MINSVTADDIRELRSSIHRVLFQSADGTINMGLHFDQPEVEMEQIIWFNILADEMDTSLEKKEGLVSICDDPSTMWSMSCYVEMHRKGFYFAICNFLYNFKIPSLLEYKSMYNFCTWILKRRKYMYALSKKSNFDVLVGWSYSVSMFCYPKSFLKSL